MSNSKRILRLHVWGPAFGLASIDAECLAAITYAVYALPAATDPAREKRHDQRNDKAWELVATSPSAVPTRKCGLYYQIIGSNPSGAKRPSLGRVSVTVSSSVPSSLPSSSPRPSVRLGTRPSQSSSLIHTQDVGDVFKHARNPLGPVSPFQALLKPLPTK